MYVDGLPAGDAAGQLRADDAAGEVDVGRSLSRNKGAGLPARPAPTAMRL